MQWEDDLLRLVDDVGAFERDFKLFERFNLFDAVGMVHQEIRHSRFLAFLLNPSAPHGLGDRFLKGVLSAALAASPAPPISRLQIALADCSDALVYTERDHFDITVHLPQLRLLFVIENKIRASERESQLLDYKNRALQRYSDVHFLGAFLTPDGYQGEDDSWSCVGYRLIADELKRLLEGGDGLSAATALAISHYLELIGKHVAVSQELVDACRRIYAQHRAALDLIIEHGQVPLLAEAFSRFAATTPEIRGYGVNSRRASFVPKEWLDPSWFQIADRKKWESPCPAQYWFRLADGKLQLRLEVGPVDLAFPFDREKFVNALRATLGEREREVTATYTRIRLRSTSVAEDVDVEQLTEKMQKLWKEIAGTESAQQVLAAANSALR